MVIIGIIFGILFIVSSYLTIKSLGSLSSKASTYYDFGGVIPSGGMWAVGLYVLAILAIVGLLLFVAKFGLNSPSA